MAKKAKRFRRTGRKAAKKWTQVERLAWVDFLKGECMFPPTTRPIPAVVKRLRGFEGAGKACVDDIMPCFADLADNVRHAAGVAALEMLRHIPHTRDNQLRDLSEAVCRIAAGDVAFLVERPEPPRHGMRRNEPAPDLFGLPEPSAAQRHAIFDLPDDTLHPIILATRRVIRATKPQTRRRA